MDEWWKSAVIYQIYPRSFKDTNGDGVGDLLGVIKKLDYLNDGTEKSLGVDAIWLSPIYKSPMADFGYDVSDYYDIDPVFGTMADFENLLSEAHKRGIKLIMDYVPNHSSDKHPWFVESRLSRDNPMRDWYIWRDAKPDGSPPNNWISVFGGSAWTLDEKTGQYYLHSFLAEQPELNWRNPEVAAELQKVLEFWMHKGVDGFRTDVLYRLIKDDKFRDEPPNPDFKPGRDNPYDALLHIYTRGQEDLVSVINNICTVLGEHRGRFMVGEMATSLPTEELLKFQNACTNQLHLPFNFNLIELPWSAKAYKKFIDEYDKQLGDNPPNWVLGNHDQMRVASRIGKDAAKVAALLTLTLRGTPFVYYGEEIGMQNTDISKDKVQDPREKRVPGFGLGRDPERTPMQWNSEKLAGFSDVEPWLPINSNFKEVNVESELKDPKSVLSLYRKLIWYRKNSKALLNGSYQSVDSGSNDVFSYLREIDGKRLLVVLNFSDMEQKVSVKVDNDVLPDDGTSGYPSSVAALSRFAGRRLISDHGRSKYSAGSRWNKKAKLILSTYRDKGREEVNLGNFVLQPHEGYLLE